MSKDDKKKLGIYLNQVPNGSGSYHYLFYMLDALYELTERFDVLGFCHIDYWHETLKKMYPKVEVINLPEKINCAVNFIDKHDCEAIIFPMDGHNAAPSKMLKTPVINVIHDIMCFYDQGFATHGGYDFARMYQMFCRHSIGVFTDSDVGREQVLDVCGRLYQDKVYALPFRPTKYLEENEPVEVVPLKNDKYFFYPSNFGYHKNHINLLLAMDKLREEGLDINFVFTGRGQNAAAKQIKKLINCLDLNMQVDIVGEINNPQMKYLYKHARAMVMPTFDGPTNIPPVEALFVGCPVAVSNLYAMPWQIGEAGLTFNPNSIEEIAFVLRRLWTDDELCCRLREKGFKRVQFLSAEKFNHRFAESLISMLAWPNKMYPYLESLYQFCRSKKVYIYGAGRYGRAAYDFLRHKNITVTGFVVSGGRSHAAYVFDKPVFTLDSAKEDMANAAIVLALGGKNLEEVQAILDANGFARATEYVFGAKHETEVFSFKMNQ